MEQDRNEMSIVSIKWKGWDRYSKSLLCKSCFREFALFRDKPLEGEINIIDDDWCQCNSCRFILYSKDGARS